MQITDNPFELRTYTKQELAKLYFPDYPKKTAGRYMARWINESKSLLQKLTRNGYTITSKVLTPKQIRIIVEHIGYP